MSNFTLISRTFLSLFVALATISCSSNSNFKINLKTDLDNLKGATINFVQFSNTDSMKIVYKAQFDKSGKAVLEGSVDSTYIVEMHVKASDGDNYILPVAIEQGDVYAILGEGALVHGTPTNIQLQQFLLDREDYYAEMILHSDLSSSYLFEKMNEFILLKQEQYGKDSPLGQYIVKYIRKY